MKTVYLLHLSLSLQSTNMRCVPFSVIADSHELFSLIISQTNWDTFIAISGVNCALRAQSFCLFRHNTHKVLLRFLPFDNLPHLWHLLEVTRAIVIGGTVRCMLDVSAPNILSQTNPGRLDLIVPRSYGPVLNVSRWSNFLIGLGYKIHPVSVQTAVPGRYHVHASLFTVFTVVC